MFFNINIFICILIKIFLGSSLMLFKAVGRWWLEKRVAGLLLWSDSALPMQKAWVQSLVWEIRSHMLGGASKKMREREWPELFSLCMNRNKTKKAQKLIYFEGISWQSSVQDSVLPMPGAQPLPTKKNLTYFLNTDQILYSKQLGEKQD